MAYSVNSLCQYASQISGLASAPGTEDRALLDTWVNDGMVEIFVDTSCVVTKVTVTLTASVDEYAMDTGILRILEYAQLASAPSSALSIVSASEILQRRFTSSVGTVRRFAILGSNILIVNPTPVAADQILFYAVPYPDAVATTDDVHSTGLPLFGKRALECYVLMRAMEYNHDYQAARMRGNPVVYGAAAYWRGMYDDELNNIRRRGRELGGRKLPMGRVGYPDQWRVPSRNDTYSSDVV